MESEFVGTEGSLYNTVKVLGEFLDTRRLPYILLGSVGLSAVSGELPRQIGDIDLGVDSKNKRKLDEFFLERGFDITSPLTAKFPGSGMVGKLLRKRYVRYSPKSSADNLLPVEVLYTPNMFSSGRFRISPLPNVTAEIPREYLVKSNLGSAIQASALYYLRSVFDSFVDPILGKNPKVVKDMETLGHYVDPIEYLRAQRDIILKICSSHLGRRFVRSEYMLQK